MDRVTELLTQLIMADNTCKITINAERSNGRETFEQIYFDPQEALRDYLELKRCGWKLTELGIDHIPMSQFESAFKKEKKEEKPERNEDHYRETILRERDKGREVSCIIADLRGETECDEDDCIECMERSWNWLYKEYRENVLKDGRDLKPGDWIMVRDGDGERWGKRQFLFYYNGKFYCELVDNSIGHGEYVSWKQARLPEEGE